MKFHENALVLYLDANTGHFVLGRIRLEQDYTYGSIQVEPITMPGAIVYVPVPNIRRVI
jgi:hypothetical protein